MPKVVFGTAKKESEKNGGQSSSSSSTSATVASDVQFRHSSSFDLYCLTLRKFQTDSLIAKFNVEKRWRSADKSVELTVSEKTAVEGRKIWSDVVSDTHAYNKNSIPLLKNKVIQRLGQWCNASEAENFCDQIIRYLQNETVIMLNFHMYKLVKKGSDYGLLNGFESGTWHNSQSDYPGWREKTEAVLFQHLKPTVKNALLSNPVARPHYAQLYLTDKDKQMLNPQMTDYGQSFFILREAIKQNSLFVPSDSLNAYGKNQYYLPAGFHDMIVLVDQMSDSRLKHLLIRVRDGNFPHGFTQHGSYNESHPYIEALIPSIDLADVGTVEHCHISANDVSTLPDYAHAFFKSLRITMTYGSVNPYAALIAKVKSLIAANNHLEAKALLDSHPALCKLGDWRLLVSPDETELIDFITKQLKSLQQDQMHRRGFFSVKKSTFEDKVAQGMCVLDAVIRGAAEHVDLEEYIDLGVFTKGEPKLSYEAYLKVKQKELQAETVRGVETPVPTHPTL